MEFDEAIEWCDRARRHMSLHGARMYAVSRNDFRRALRAISAPRSTEAILEPWGFGWPTIRAWLRDEAPMPDAPRDPAAEEALAETPADPEVDPDPQRVWGVLKAAHKEASDRHDDLSHRRVRIEGDRPVGIVLMGDVHVGSTATDYERLDWIIELTKRTDIDVRAVQIGDVLDAMLMSWARHTLSKQRSSISEQAHAAAFWLERIAPNLVGLCGGNHDAWSERMTGINILEHAMSLAKIKTKGPVPYHPIELWVTIQLGPHEYVFLLRHKVRGHSMYNPAHGVQRHVRFNLREHVDVLVAGHTHRSGAQRIGTTTGITHAIQVGTYKIEHLDGYAQTEGFAAENFSPDMLAIIRADQRRLTLFDELDTGIEYLEFLSNEKKNKNTKKKNKG